jgi:hypothetical protein
MSRKLQEISDIATQAHEKIQAEFEDINPVIGVSRRMRKSGIPADAMTIDCLRTNRRILLVLHDEQPDIVHFQFGERDKDPGATFQTIAFEELNLQQCFDWMVQEFSQ